LRVGVDVDRRFCLHPVMTTAPKAWTAPEITVLRAASDAQITKTPDTFEGFNGSFSTSPSGAV
jgi:hypothetical protein